VAFDARIPLFHQPQLVPAAQAPAAQAPKKDDTVADGTVNAKPLCRRLAAIKLALDDLPRQAKRYARWQARPIEARHPYAPAGRRVTASGRRMRSMRS
jgi:hypothetical protein